MSSFFHAGLHMQVWVLKTPNLKKTKQNKTKQNTPKSLFDSSPFQPCPIMSSFAVLGHIC